MLAQNPKFSSKLYGQQRLWGSIGQAVITQINAFGLGSRLKYNIMFLNLAWTTVLFVLCVFFGIPETLQAISEKKPGMAEGKSEAQARPTSAKPLLESKDEQPDEERPSTPIDASIQPLGRSMFQPVRLLLCNPHFTFFLFVIFIQGYGRSILGNFHSYYFQNIVKQEPVIFGLISNTRLLSEILLFFCGKQLLQHFGTFWVMMFGLLAGALRILAYGIIPPSIPWSYTAFFWELLKGINSACCVMAGVKMAHELAPAGCEATAQGFFSGIYSSLANAMSGILGGLILKLFEKEQDGLPKLFLITGIICLVSSVAFGLKHALLPAPIQKKDVS